MFFALVTLGINYYFVSKCLIIKLKHSSQRKKDTHQSVPFYS
nr:MAG TPA: holin [Caudoviricetes sp.]